MKFAFLFVSLFYVIKKSIFEKNEEKWIDY